MRNTVWNQTEAGIKVKSYVGGGGPVEYSAINVSLHGVPAPIELDQHYGGAKPPCMPHCSASHRPVFTVEIVGMHADGIPLGHLHAPLGPSLNGTAGPNAIVLTVSDSTFITADGKPALWRCENAHITARGVVPMPGTCSKTAGATASSTPSKTDDTQQLLSRQAREWWRGVVVRRHQSSTFIPDGDDETRGPMIAMHVVNTDFSSPLATVPPFQLTMSAEDLAAARQDGPRAKQVRDPHNMHYPPTRWP